MNSETSLSEQDQCLNATEHVVATLWREVLQTSELPRATDNFFDLGGDSMMMTMVEFRIKEELSVELPAGTLLGAPSLRDLSALIEAKIGDPHSATLRNEG